MIAPCIVCGFAIGGIAHFAQTPTPLFNQPEGGTGFTTEGHYGSTVFDPMNGNTLSISVCDDCLKNAGQQGRVLLGRDWKPVVAVVEGSSRPCRVGSTSAPRALTVWNPEAHVEYDDESLEIEPEEVGVIDGVLWAPAFRGPRPKRES